MRNADLPAMPIWELNGWGEQELSSTGLTKREMFAMAAMQGMLSTGSRGFAAHALAARAIEYADALLAGLEKEDGS